MRLGSDKIHLSEREIEYRRKGIQEEKFFIADEIFSHKYPSTVAEDFRGNEELNYNTHDSSEYALARSAKNAAGEQINIDSLTLEPYVCFEFMKIMTEKKQEKLKNWKDGWFGNSGSDTVQNAIKKQQELIGTKDADGNFTHGQISDQDRQLIEDAAADRDLTDKAIRVFSGSIAMYMPTDIQINDVISYNESSRQIAAALEDFGTSDKVNNATLYNPGSFALLGAASGKLSGAISKSAKTGPRLTKFFAKGDGLIGGLLGYGAGGVISDEMQRHHGTKLNPNDYMAYGSTPMRSFSFAFNFLPDSVEESGEATRIIKQFRLAAHAEKNDNITVTVPDHCIVSFHGAQDMIQLPACVIESVNVSYNPNNTSFFKHKNAPVEINLSVTVKEIAPIYKGDVERGF